MSFLKVAGLRFIVFSILFTSIFIGCSNSVSIKKLVFNQCQILLDGKLYSGEYQKNNLNNNLIIGIEYPKNLSQKVPIFFTSSSLYI